MILPVFRSSTVLLPLLFYLCDFAHAFWIEATIYPCFGCLLDGRHGTRLNSKKLLENRQRPNYPPYPIIPVTHHANHSDSGEQRGWPAWQGLSPGHGIMSCSSSREHWSLSGNMRKSRALGNPSSSSIPRSSIPNPRPNHLEDLVAMRGCGAPGCQWDALPSVLLKWYCCCVCELVPCCSPVCCSCARPHHVALWRTQSSSQSAPQTQHMPLCLRLGGDERAWPAASVCCTRPPYSRMPPL